MLYCVHPFIIGITLSGLWYGLRNNVKGTMIQKSLKFGTFYETVVTFPYMFLIYIATNVSLPIIYTWLFFGFVEATSAALIFNKLYKI